MSKRRAGEPDRHSRNQSELSQAPKLSQPCFRDLRAKPRLASTVNLGAPPYPMMGCLSVIDKWRLSRTAGLRARLRLLVPASNQRFAYCRRDHADQVEQPGIAAAML